VQKTATLAIIIGLLLGYTVGPPPHAQSLGSQRPMIVVPVDLHTIQEAIDKASSGDTILVKAGIYPENIFINKPISLIGEDKFNTIIDGSNSGTVIEVTASNVSIENFTVRDAGSSIEDSGIELSSTENCTVNGNVVIENGYNGIMVSHSAWNTVTRNTIAEATHGIILVSSSSDTVSENDVENASRYGIALQDSRYCQVTENNVTSSYEDIALLSSNGNYVSRNIVTNSTSKGIRLDDPSDYNTFTENTITNNGEYGFWMWYSSHNLFYHNFCNNSDNVLVLSAPELGYNSTNTWDNGYPFGGNCWSDYHGKDLYSGAYQNETGSDGIGDTPYFIDKDNIDRYPLMTPNLTENPQANTHPIHNLETCLSYATIQEAIDAPETLDKNTIFVQNGTYQENIVVTKAIKLIGESEETTIIDGNSQGSVVELAADNVTITGFTLKNSGPGWAQSAIALSRVCNCSISSNDITNNQFGVWAESSTGNVISGNNFTNDGYGIGLYTSSDGNSILENKIVGSAHAGILLASCTKNVISRNRITGCAYSVELITSSNNTITENDVTNNSHGVTLSLSSNENDIVGNTIRGNGWGLETDTSTDNRIFHNNFVNNTPQVFFYEPGYSNFWDQGYPEGGNYWSDQNSTDLHSGPYQNETGSDGIADTPHSIDSNNEDHYPLMGMFGEFAAYLPNSTGTDYVDIISNSTVSDFHFQTWLNSSTQYLQNGQLLILFSVVQESGTAGFCRLTFPMTVLNASTYTVLVDWNPVNVLQIKTANSNMVYLYFTYVYPSHEIAVTIPEFPWTTLLSIIIVTTSTAFFKRKRLMHRSESSI
jgi:parallel beta-helix repeat protein